MRKPLQRWVCSYFCYLLKWQRIFIIHHSFRCSTRFDGASRPGSRDSEIPPTGEPNDLELDRKLIDISKDLW